MKVNRVTDLLDKYAACQRCGSEMIGNGEGTLDIGDDYFTRTCKCGWVAKVEERKGIDDD